MEIWQIFKKKLDEDNGSKKHRLNFKTDSNHRVFKDFSKMLVSQNFMFLL